MSEVGKLLEISNLKMYYKIRSGDWVKAVDDISFTLKERCALGIVGESGSGKSSLAFTLIRLLPENGKILGGKVFFKNRDILKIPEDEYRKEIRWKSISLIPQAAMNALNPVIRVGDQIVEAILHCDRKIEKEEAMERTKRLFELVGIDPDRTSNYPHEFSGGMRQRIMIAMALSCYPKIVIADEPTTALDVITQANILKLLIDLRKKMKISIILITHDLSIVSELCDKVIIMYAGKIVEYGRLEDVYKNPLHPYTHGLLSAIPDIKGRTRALKPIPGSPPNLISPPPGCRFHPRCLYADNICREKEPPLIEVEKEHYVACHKVR